MEVTHSLCLSLFSSLFLTVFHSIRIQEFVVPHIRVQRYKMCDYHHAWPRECVWVCVWSWPVVLHAAAKIQKTKTPKHSDAHIERERECRRNLLLKIAETPLNTSLCRPCRCFECVWVCVCVLHIPAHVSGRLWGCVGGWMERSGRALASSCYHTRSHPNLSARSEREREEKERSVFDLELLQITVQWIKSHATHWGLENGDNLSTHTHTHFL